VKEEAIRSVVVIGLAACALIASGWFSPQASAHGGLSIERDKCVLRVGTHIIHFTGYQPQETDTQEFCEDIPKTGKTVVALDYVDPAMRKVPVEVKILRVVDKWKADDEQPVEFSLPPTSYSTGTIHFEHDFAEAGRYVGLVMAKEGGADEVGRFPFAVGTGWPPLLRIGWKVLAVMILGIGLAVLLIQRQAASDERARRRRV
jgi:hypothetical protein